MRPNEKSIRKTKNMRSRSLIIVAALTASVAATGAELAPFDEVRAQYQSYKDPTRLSYLYNRCAALQLNTAALMRRKNQVKAAFDFEALAQHYMVLSEANEREIDKKRGLKNKDTMKIVQRNVSVVSEAYSKRLRSNYAARGEYIIGDSQLEQELSECLAVELFVKKSITAQ